MALLSLSLCTLLGLGACGSDAPPGPPGPTSACAIPAGEAPDYASKLGCQADFEALGARPLDASIPGARSAKTVIDQADGSALYFTNSNKYPIHYDFASKHLSGHGLPPIGELSLFNATEYYSPSRRFLLGAVTRYDNPGVWVYEIAPYDTSTAAMVADAYGRIRDASFFGKDLYFHPTSSSVEALVPDLPPEVKVMTSDQLFAGISYQPLNLGEALGQLRFYEAAKLGTTYVGPRDIAVLDHVPNDIAVVSGLITEEIQTPLSHVNVLSQNRGTPNMSLKGAFTDPALRKLENSWVRLVVSAFDYKVEPVTKAEADAYWEAHKPPPIKVPPLDLSVKDLRDCTDIRLTDIPAFGGKASHYGELTRIGELVPMQDAFAVPVFYYKQFVEQNGFDAQIAALLADEKFASDPFYRDAKLATLRLSMTLAPVDPAFLADLEAKIAAKFPGQPIRFRSSTNSEDLNGFTGAGLYTSKSGEPGNPKKSFAEAIRKVWASLWNFRAFEERTYRGIPHEDVAMALLVHPSFPTEDANGVALTANMFDDSQPAFYINAQKGDASVVLPDPGVTADSFLYYYYYAGQPITFFSHSSLIPAGQTVLTNAETYRLGQALEAIHGYFAQYYQTGDSFYAMDVEFKFDGKDPKGNAQLWIKQARPHYGWNEQ
ncbi:MAG: PEP/pyruvate-binding domain-containing protein [Byssovorax sp.]